MARSNVNEKEERYKPITLNEVDFIANNYTSIMRRIAHLFRTGKVGILLAHLSYLHKYIMQNRAVNKYDFFDYVAGFFLHMVKEDVEKYYKQEITTLEIEDSLKRAITQWCRYHKVKTFANLDKLKIDN